MAKIGYITEKTGDGVMASLGMDVFTLEQHHDLSQLLKDLKNDNYAVVYVSETIYEQNIEKINHFNDDFSLTVLVLASELQHKNLGQKRLKTLIEDAVGVKVE